MLSIGSLFSGIGGLDLGLEWAGLGPVLWQVEKNPFRRAVLEKHWPHAERFDDARLVSAAELVSVDLVCGGFPCVDVSSAGPRTGLAGSRSGLWREFSRVVSEIRPEWVVVENVASGAKLWFDAVVLELERAGYDCLPLPVSAGAVGAPHRRARIFIVAHRQLAADADGDRLRQQQRRRQARGQEALELAATGQAPGRARAHTDSVGRDARAGESGQASARRSARRSPKRSRC